MFMQEAEEEVKRGEGGHKEAPEQSSFQAPQSKLLDLAKTLLPFNPSPDVSFFVKELKQLLILQQNISV